MLTSRDFSVLDWFTTAASHRDDWADSRYSGTVDHLSIFRDPFSMFSPLNLIMNRVKSSFGSHLFQQNPLSTGSPLSRCYWRRMNGGATKEPSPTPPAWATLGDPRKDDSKPDSTRQELDALDLEHCLGSLRLLAMVSSMGDTISSICRRILLGSRLDCKQHGSLIR